MTLGVGVAVGLGVPVFEALADGLDVSDGVTPGGSDPGMSVGVGVGGGTPLLMLSFTIWPA